MVTNKQHEKEKVVCIWIDKEEEGEKGERCYEWFKIQDLESIESDAVNVAELETQVFKSQGTKMDLWPNNPPNPHILFPTPVALNNSIYYLGGQYADRRVDRYSNTVTYFDTTKSPIELISVSPMINVINPALAVVHNGCIFTFRRGPQVFKDGIWRTFSGPKHDPQTDYATPPALSDPVNNRIILHFWRSNSLYAYHPPPKEAEGDDYDKEDRWECITSNFDLLWMGICALVDDFIITYHGCYPDFFSAYDLVNHKSSPLVWSDNKILDHYVPLFVNDELPWDDESLFHLGGGKLCMFRSYSRNMNYMAVDCFTFTVHNNGGVMTLTAPVFKCFHLETSGFRALNYLLL